MAAVRGLYLAVPFADYWRVTSHLHEIQSFDFRYLWQQHNEHRIVFPDIVFALDVLVFRMRRILPVALSSCCYLASWLLLIYPAARDSALKRADRALLVFATGALVGWKGVALSLADPFLLQWTLMSFTALLAVSLLAIRTTNLHLALAIACATVATYSCGSGLLLWPVLWIFGKLRKLSSRQYLVLLLAGCFFIALYFVGYRVADTNSLANLLHHPFYALGFVAMYFSMPFGGMKSAHFGLYIGAVAVCVFPFLVALAFRSRIGLVACGWYLFVLLSAITIAAGRMEPADTTFTAAKASRYLVPVMLSWGALLVLLFWTAAVRRWRIASPLVLTLFLASLLLLSNRKLSWWWTISLRPYIAAQITEVSLENDIFDPELVRQIFPSPEFVAHYLPELKRSHLSIYANAPLIGQTFASGSALPGEIIRRTPVLSGLEVIGGRSSSRVSRVVLLDAEKTIIGTGRSLAFGLPTELMPPHTSTERAWIAFIPAPYATRSFSALVY